MKNLVGILLLFAAINLQAQYVRPGDETSPSPPGTATLPANNGFANKLSIGGSFGLQFGYTTAIELEPLLNYHFNQSFMIGLGPVYQYLHVDGQVYGYAYTSSTYGGRVVALYFLPEELSKIFVMGEYDVLNIPELSFYSYQIDRGYLYLPMLGIGYKEVVSDKVFFSIYGLWNFNNSIYNPYSNPIINFGVDIGLWH